MYMKKRDDMDDDDYVVFCKNARREECGKAKKNNEVKKKNKNKTVNTSRVSVALSLRLLYIYINFEYIVYK